MHAPFRMYNIICTFACRYKSLRKREVYLTSRCMEGKIKPKTSYTYAEYQLVNMIIYFRQSTAGQHNYHNKWSNLNVFFGFCIFLDLHHIHIATDVFNVCFLLLFCCVKMTACKINQNAYECILLKLNCMG